MNNKIGELIEKYRKEKGLTQSELAKKLGVSNTAISKWEHGNNLPDITLLEPLSEILGIDKLILFSTENEIKEETSERVKSLKRRNTIKLVILSIIFIFTIIFTNYISYKVYEHKLDTIKSSQSTIYKFTSTDPEFIANGYLILSEKGSNVIFEQLEYQRTNQNKNRKTIKDELNDIELVELYFYANEELIYSFFCNQKEESKIDINNLFKNLAGFNYESKKIILEKHLHDVKIELKIQTSKEHIQKEIFLNLSSEI